MSLTHAMELAYAVGWVGGFALFWFRTRRAFLLGAYLGCSLSMGFDWVLSSARVWNLQFAPDTIYLYSWYGLGQPLWGPVSYGVFYGLICMPGFWETARFASSACGPTCFCFQRSSSSMSLLKERSSR